MKYDIILSVLLISCGGHETSDTVSTPAAAAPDFTDWQTIDGATDQCFDIDSKFMDCQTKFTAGDSNCGDAAFKFIAIRSGVMHVITIEKQIIRQGQFHMIDFTGEPEIFSSTESDDASFPIFQCRNQDGEVIAI